MTTRDKTEEQLLTSVRQTRTQAQTGDAPDVPAGSQTEAPRKKAAPAKKKRAVKKAATKPVSSAGAKASPSDREAANEAAPGNQNPFRRRGRVWPD